MKTIGIFLAGQAGDIMEAASVLKYRQELWGDCKIVWYIAEGNEDLLSYQDIELRTFPRGFGYPKMVYEENKKLVDAGKEPIWENWQSLVDENNHMNLELKKNFTSLADIDYGYFPAPHQILLEKRHNISYPDCSKMVFGIPDHYEWHPVLSFSDEEMKMANSFIERNGGKKRVMIESFAGSGQSLLDQPMIECAIDLCNKHWDDCLFIFASHKFLKSNEQYPSKLLARPDTTACPKFTVRQCALIAEKCDLMISVSSGITVAASAWNIKQPPTIQFTGSFICSTKSIANGLFELVTADDKTLDQAKQEFYAKLEQLLIQYK